MSRELDREVAEKVMGLAVVQGSGDPSMTYPVGTGIAVAPVHPYSSDIRYAFLVVERMRTEGWIVHLTLWPDGRGCDLLKPGSMAEVDISVRADTLEVAICNASLEWSALKAKEGGR